MTKDAGNTGYIYLKESPHRKWPYVANEFYVEKHDEKTLEDANVLIIGVRIVSDGGRNE
jgi:hypothetical protein